MREEKNADKATSSFLKQRWLLNTGLVFVFGLWCLWFFIYTSGFDNGELAAKGDAFGSLTSLFTGLSFVGLIWTIRLQSQELGDTRKELEGQKDALKSQVFNDTFFKYIENHRTLINSLSDGTRKDTRFGRDALVTMLDQLNREIRTPKNPIMYTYYNDMEDILLSLNDTLAFVNHSKQDNVSVQRYHRIAINNLGKNQFYIICRFVAKLVDNLVSYPEKFKYASRINLDDLSSLDKILQEYTGHSNRKEFSND